MHSQLLSIAVTEWVDDTNTSHAEKPQQTQTDFKKTLNAHGGYEASFEACFVDFGWVLVNWETKLNEKRNETEATPTIIKHLSAHVWPLYRASTATSGSFVSSSIVNQVRLYNAVYVLLLLWFLGGGKLICLAREGHIQPGFVYLANFSLWFTHLLIHINIYIHITVELS